MASSSAYRQTQIFLKKTRERIRVDETLISSRFRLIDAKGEVLGRLASQISYILQGKDKPTFDRSKPLGDAIVVINASKIHLSGRKMEQKKFHRHTGYVGGLVTRTAKAMLGDIEDSFMFTMGIGLRFYGRGVQVSKIDFITNFF